MKNSYSIEDRDDYIEVHSEGIKDYDFGVRMWTDLVERCSQSNCFRILGIANTSNPPQAWEAFDIAGVLRDVGVNMKYKIAWVEQNGAALRGVEFVGTVLMNRGLGTGRIFADVEHARQWLLEEANSE